MSLGTYQAGLSFRVYTLKESKNGGVTLKTRQMFSFHTTPEELKNAKITSHFGFVFGDSKREIR